MEHTYSLLLTHIIFSTKDRIPYLKESVRDPVFGYMSGIAREIGGKDVVVNGESDHVHMLVRLPPALAIAEAIQKIKSNSSKWIHAERLLSRAFGWQPATLPSQ